MADATIALLQAIPGVAKLVTEIAGASEAAQRNAQLIQFQNALIGLNSILASVQQDNATLTQQKRDAEEELKRMKDWETEKKRYKMVAAHQGSFVFALKREMSNGESPHYLCANCFKQGKPSILNDLAVNKSDSWHSWVCPNCPSKNPTGLLGASQTKYAEDFPTPK